MVERVTAYKCEVTGALYGRRYDAVESEFISRMKQAGGSLPSYGSVNSIEMLGWIARQVTSGVYPAFFSKLLEAALWWEENRGAVPPQVQEPSHET